MIQGVSSVESVVWNFRMTLAISHDCSPGHFIEALITYMGRASEFPAKTHHDWQIKAVIGGKQPGIGEMPVAHGHEPAIVRGYQSGAYLCLEHKVFCLLPLTQPPATDPGRAQSSHEKKRLPALALAGEQGQLRVEPQGMHPATRRGIGAYEGVTGSQTEYLAVTAIELQELPVDTGAIVVLVCISLVTTTSDDGHLFCPGETRRKENQCYKANAP